MWRQSVAASDRHAWFWTQVRRPVAGAPELDRGIWHCQLLRCMLVDPRVHPLHLLVYLNAELPPVLQPSGGHVTGLWRQLVGHGAPQPATPACSGALLSTASTGFQLAASPRLRPTSTAGLQPTAASGHKPAATRCFTSTTK